jgi:AraC family transcriptional regulator
LEKNIAGATSPARRQKSRRRYVDLFGISLTPLTWRGYQNAAFKIVLISCSGDLRILPLQGSYCVIDHLRSRTLFSSPLLAVHDLDCTAPRGDCSAEESSSRHSVVFPRSGVFVKRTSKQDQLVAESSRVLFFNRHESYRVSHPVAGGDHCTSIQLSQTALVDFIYSIDPSIEKSPDRPFRSSAATSSASIALNLHRLRRLLLTKQPLESLLVEEICASLLADSVAAAYERRDRIRQPIRRATRQAHRDLVDATRVVLARRCREKLTLSEIARAVFSSPFHLARIFRRETGTSLHRQQNRLRLRLALEHLLNGKPDLTVLALDLGFSSHAHFTQAFRTEFDCAPSEFSRRL